MRTPEEIQEFFVYCNMNRLEDIFLTLAPVKLMDASIEDYVPIDISVSNEALDKFDVSSSKEWEGYIESHLKNNNANIAYGGYLEVRDIYSRSSYFNNSKSEERNIHLGMDLWTEAATPVFAPLDGIVHSFQNNTNYGDYGPTIVLEHQIDSQQFFTLYGHLSVASLNNIKRGQKLQKGEIVGYLGDASVNGDYAPHLHFQLMLSMGEYSGDYPGVCSKKELDFYRSNCPDPNLLLKLPS